MKAIRISMVVVFLLLAGILGLVFASQAGATPANAPGQKPGSISDLPVIAQASISRVLGRDNSKYHFLPAYAGWADADSVSGGWRTPKSAQGLEANFTESGVQVRAGEAAFSLKLVSYGRGNELKPAPPLSRYPIRSSLQNRLEYTRGAVQEWYVNGPLGLEQGFTISTPLAVGSTQPELTLALALDTDLAYSLDAGAKGITLYSSRGGVGFHYGGLAAFDAAGKALPARMETGAPGSHTLFLRVDDRDAQYPILIDPWIQVSRLSMLNGVDGAWLGTSVAVSEDGNTIVVGANQEDNGTTLTVGAAYVFVKPADGWIFMSETARLTPSDNVAYLHFGTSVSINSDTIVVGAKGDDFFTTTGAAYVFDKPFSGWSSTTQTAKLTASGGAAEDLFGASVSISGDTIVVGAPQRQDTLVRQGTAYVFVRPGGGWANSTENAKLLASDAAAYDDFGVDVAVRGSTIAVGADSHPVDTNTSQGTVYVFVRPGNGWSGILTESSQLIAFDGFASDNLGRAVAISEDSSTIVAGAPYNNDQGAAYVFVEPAGGWSGIMYDDAKLTASDGALSDFFGTAVGISGSNVVVGASFKNVGTTSTQGSAYLYAKPVTGWFGSQNEDSQVTASSGTVGDTFGASVAINGDIVVAGAPLKDYGSFSAQGVAFVYQGGPVSMVYLPVVSR